MKNIVLFVAEINKPGGTERVVANLANNFTRHHYAVTVISVNTFSGDPFYPIDPAVKLIHLGVKLERNVVVRSSYGFYHTVSKIKNAVRRLEQNAILLATDPITCFAFALVKKSFPRHRYVACEHMGLAIAKWHSRTARQLFYRNLDALVVLTQRDKNMLLARKVKMPACYVIPNELSFWPQQTSNCLAHQLIAVGKYDGQKRFDLLLDIVHPLLLRYKDWKLFLIGQGILKPVLEQKIQQYQLQGQVELIAPTQQIIDYYQRSSIYLMTSAYEGFPMVLLEAQACGLPIVAYDCPSGPGEMIDNGSDGILVPYDDATAFEEALDTLMQNEGLRIEMGKKARINVAKYDSERIFERWNTLFKTM